MKNTFKKISESVPSPRGRARVGVLFLLLPFTFYAQTNTFPASGNVGIGTTSPEAKLQVNNTGTIGAKWNPSNSYLTIKDNSNAMIIDPNEIYSSQTIRIGTAAGDIRFGNVSETGVTEIMAIKENGRVGIGTTAPQGGLHIRNENGLLIESSGFPGSIKMSDGFTNTTTRDDMLFESDGAFLFKLDRNANGISNIPGFGIFDKNNYVIFLARDNGNVGIGTVSPDAKLTVKGNIHTREVKVDLNGAVAPDYVFKKDYNLRSLEDVQAFIEKNGHLPGIPSAKEMETDGVNLKEMNLKLLEKVEELTLYVIAQRKALDEFKKNKDQ